MYKEEKNPKAIHETVIRDIVTFINGGLRRNNDYDELVLWGNGAKHSFRSITKATSNLILTFPILVSDTVDLEAATMLCKSHERKCAAMMHMLFSALCVSDEYNNVYDYLKQFHKNINFDEDELNIDNFNDTMDDVADNIEEVTNLLYNSQRFKYETKQAFLEDMKNLDFYVVEAPFIMPSIEDNMKHLYNESLTSINEGRKGGYTWDSNWGEQPKGWNRMSPAQQTQRISQIASSRAGQVHGMQQGMNAMRTRGGGIDKDPHWSKKYADVQSGLEKEHRMRMNPFVDTDVKKANELLPTMVVIHFHTLSSNEPVTAVIGIKAKIYKMSSDQILSRLVVRNRDNQGFFNFLRTATRETSFFKDFVFALDKAKIDALSSSHRGSDSKIWKLLERRAIKSKVRRGLGMANDATAITTVAITQDEVEILKKDYDINIDSISTIKPIMDAYNLMGFVIIDNNIEAMKFLYDDGSNAYDTLSFNMLEREANDSNYKKVINLMTKMVRS